MSAPRVMLLAPMYWISGTVTLAREMQRGLPGSIIACATRSGRPSTLWGRDVSAIKRATSTAWTPDLAMSGDELLTTMRESFDVVHVTEPDITASHRDWWHDILERIPIPWSLTLNGNTYPDVDWNRIIQARNFMRVVWHTPGHLPAELTDPRHGVRIASLPRPYTLRHDVHEQLPRGAHPTYDGLVVGTHCRVAPDKGVALVAALAQHLGVRVCVDGAPQGGAMPYTLELRKPYDIDPVLPAEAPWLAGPLPGHLAYAGAFADGVRTAQHHSVHVSGTRLGFSAGHEYALLEAVDAGCVIVQPEHMTEPLDSFTQYTYPWERRGVIGALRSEHTPLTDAVRQAVTHVTSGYDQSVNRDVIKRHHDPKRLTLEFDDVVLSVI